MWIWPGEETEICNLAGLNGIIIIIIYFIYVFFVKSVGVKAWVYLEGMQWGMPCEWRDYLERRIALKVLVVVWE